MACQNLAPLEILELTDSGAEIINKINLAFAKTDSNQDCIHELEVYQALQLTGIPNDLHVSDPHNATMVAAINYNYDSIGDMAQLPGWTSIVEAINAIHSSRATETEYGLSRLATQSEVNSGQIHQGLGEHAAITPYTLANLQANSPLANALTDVIQATTPSNQATETEQGMAQIATQAEADDGTNDQVILTPAKLRNVDPTSTMGLAIKNMTPLANESNFGRVQLADQTETNDGAVHTVVITPLRLSGYFDHRKATESDVGTIELAEQTEVDSETDDERAVTPLKLATYLNSRNAAVGQSGLVELATTVDIEGQTDNTKAVTPAGLAHLFDFRAASETVQGTIEIATTSDINDGTDDTKAVTPKKYHDDITPVKTNVSSNTSNIANLQTQVNANTSNISNKADNTITISAGSGLSGGGDLTVSRTLDLNLGSLGNTTPTPTVNIPFDLGGTSYVTHWTALPHAQSEMSYLDSGFTTTSTTFVSTGLSRLISPRSANSKFKVTLSGVLSCDVDGTIVSLRILRDGNPITPNGGNGAHVEREALNGKMDQFNVCIIDEPNTNSDVTYTVEMKVDANTGAIGSKTDGTMTTPVTLVIDEIMG
jgi:hypothetical protein